jgi:hypothetical protein
VAGHLRGAAGRGAQCSCPQQPALLVLVLVLGNWRRATAAGARLLGAAAARLARAPCALPLPQRTLRPGCCLRAMPMLEATLAVDGIPCISENELRAGEARAAAHVSPARPAGPC